MSQERTMLYTWIIAGLVHYLRGSAVAIVFVHFDKGGVHFVNVDSCRFHKL
jgi:hypothetical protein